MPASFLTFGDHPLYTFYDHVPRLFGSSALDDMQFAGLDHEDRRRLHPLARSITIIFFRWYNAEELGSRRAGVCRATSTVT